MWILTVWQGPSLAFPDGPTGTRRGWHPGSRRGHLLALASERLSLDLRLCPALASQPPAQAGPDAQGGTPKAGWALGVRTRPSVPLMPPAPSKASTRTSPSPWEALWPARTLCWRRAHPLPLPQGLLPLRRGLSLALHLGLLGGSA